MQKLWMALCLLIGCSAAALAFNEEQAVSRALDFAGLSDQDLTALKIEDGEEDGLKVFKLELETPFADYDIAWAQADGSLAAADFELDDEYVRAQDLGRVLSMAEAQAQLASWLQVPVSCFKLTEQGSRTEPRFEGRCRHQGMKYELELDRRSGLVSDFTAERSE